MFNNIITGLHPSLLLMQVQQPPVSTVCARTWWCYHLKGSSEQYSQNPAFHLHASQALWICCCCYHCCFVLFLQSVYCLNAESVWYNWTVYAIFVFTVVDIRTAFQIQCQYVWSVFLPHYMYLACFPYHITCT